MRFSATIDYFILLSRSLFATFVELFKHRFVMPLQNLTLCSSTVASFVLMLTLHFLFFLTLLTACFRIVFLLHISCYFYWTVLFFPSNSGAQIELRLFFVLFRHRYVLTCSPIKCFYLFYLKKSKTRLRFTCTVCIFHKKHRRFEGSLWHLFNRNALWPVLAIRDILVRIRIHSSD